MLPWAIATSATYEYNDAGIRISKTVGGAKHTYYLNGTQIVAEEWGNKLLVYLYDESGSPIGMQYCATAREDYEEGEFDTYWFEKNLQGDIIAVYNDAGTLLATYAYDAWGGIASLRYSNGGSGTAAQYNPFRYRGYYRDSETGFYYLNSRYYDPNTGRFINADGIIAGTSGDVHGFNLYAYCFNNPVSMSDSDGNWPTWNDVKKWAKKTANWIEKKGTKVKKFIEDIDNIIDNNVTFEAGICIGIGGEFDTPIGGLEAMTRCDIVGISINRNGEIESGHYGRSALAIQLGLFSLGPQNSSYESYDNEIIDKGDPSLVESGLSWGGGMAFGIGYHYSASISFSGMIKDIYNYLNDK